MGEQDRDSDVFSIEAFEALWREWWPQWWPLALRLSRGDPDKAEEYLQESLVRVFIMYSATESNLAPMIPITLRRVVIDAHRLTTRHRAYVRHVRHASPFAPRTDEPAIDAEMKGIVGDALLTLSEQDFQILTLKHYVQCTFVEISKTLDLPEGTVKTRYYAAIKTLRDSIKEDPRA